VKTLKTLFLFHLLVSSPSHLSFYHSLFYLLSDLLSCLSAFSSCFFYAWS
jgi:hypothetical protein